MNCRTIRALGMAMAMLAGGMMVQTTAQAQTAAKAKAAASSELEQPSAVYGQMLKGLSSELVAAAEAMPADKYDFAPTNGNFAGVRTFGAEVQHIVQANYFFFSGFGLSGAPDQAKLKSLKSKDELVQALKDSFDYCAEGHRHHHAAKCLRGHRHRSDEHEDDPRRRSDLLPRSLDGSLRADGGIPAHEWHRASSEPEAAQGRRQRLGCANIQKAQLSGCAFSVSVANYRFSIGVYSAGYSGPM